ncbi:hypothetical protein ACA910_000637 [Epithemia clementina (nom. ined.)]
MDNAADQSSVLRAIAISSISSPSFTQTDRQTAYAILDELKRYNGRISLALQWLLSERHVYEGHDITTQTKLLALDLIAGFLQKGYNNLNNENDRLQLRDSILKAARMASSGNESNSNEARVLAKKLAAILQGLVVRDFPQRWPTFIQDVFKPLSAGGLWCDEPSLAASNQQIGVHICLECLKLIAEDCTDSDYNANISTQRRNDVLIGLNEVSREFLPLLFQLLEQYPMLQQAKLTLHNMNTFLLQNNRTIQSLSSDERAQYEEQMRLRQAAGQMIADTLLTLSHFCTSMPIAWMLEGYPDFIAAMMHLFRENDCEIQIRAAECIEELAVRGKLEYAQWIRFLVELPAAIGEANNMASTSHDIDTKMLLVKGQVNNIPDMLAAQVGFHKILSRMLSIILSSHVGHITSNKATMEGKGGDFARLTNFVRLLVEILQHPSGRICSEQVTLWSMLLRDPQISRSGLLPPYAQQILSCYMNQLVKVRWADVEEETHPLYKVLEASFDDEEDYDSWMSDLRSRSSLLFKFIGHVAPAIAAETLNERLKTCLAAHGNGHPLNFLDPNSQQLTQKSDAVIQFEALTQPFETVLAGIPPWTLDDQSTPPKDQENYEAIRSRTRAALAEFSQNLINWAPDYLWLRFRRASLLECLKYYWKYEPSTLLQGVDSLIRYIGLADEWSAPNLAGAGLVGDERMSGETIGLKKKSGVSLVVIAKHVPEHLVPWLTELSNATSSLLASPGLIPMNQMHLYEFLTCVASAVEDPSARAGFIANVLSSPLETLRSAEVQQQISSPEALIAALGIAAVGENPQNATNPEYVRRVTLAYNLSFTALNRLLSVGKRCNEAARKRGSGIGILQAMPGTAPHVFIDEGPVSLQDLAALDPFCPLWPQILPSLIALTNSVLGMWKPEYQAVLLRHQWQRYALAISDDEAYTSKNHDKSSGGVFGEGGTAGSVVSGTDRRDTNLLPKWSGWLNELRNTCFQMFGLLATSRALFAPEVRDMYPALVSAMVDSENLKAMEHRHFSQYLKHIGELLMVSCPSTLYPTHLGPIIGPILEHIRYRLEFTWSPVLTAYSPQGDRLARSTSETATSALTSNECLQAAELASANGTTWYSWWYAHCGLFVGDLDKVTADAAVEKYRVDLGRVFSDVLQSALALKGDWALVLANRAKEEQASKRNDTSTLFTGPKSKIYMDDGKELNADGTPKSEHQSSIDARKLMRINGLCHFLLLENESIAGNLTLTVIQSLGYPDEYTVRRITKICHRILETVAFSPQYTDLLGRQMFSQAIKNIVTEPKWMVGLEWSMINIVRDIYCRLVLGQILLPGGQGAAAQQPNIGQSKDQYEQAKTVDEPLHGGGILQYASQVPRQILADIPGVGASMVEQMEESLRTKRSAKDQKDAVRDILRVASDNVKDMFLSTTGGAESLGAAAGIFGRAGENESLLHTKTKQSAVPALPEKLVTRSQMERKNRATNLEQPEGLSAFHIE